MGSEKSSGFEATLAVDNHGLVATQLDADAGVKRPPLNNAPPARIGRYLIVDELGRGGMGVVYAAYDPELDRKVAIKLLHGDRSDPAAQARLVREAQAMARLSHPHVVHVHDVGTTAEDSVFVAMEYIEGQTLGEWLEAAPRSSEEVLEIFRQAGEGLAAAHAVDLIHRDFKPDNVLLGEDLQAKISDFGLARAAAIGETAEGMGDEEPPPRTEPELRVGTLRESQEGVDLTRTGTILGTPAYMSPEQHLGERANAQSDQYSLCVALYEALYGRRPFEGKTLGELRLKVLGGALGEAPNTPGVPRWIFPILARGLHPEPESRWPSISALLAALSRDPNRARRRWVLGVVLLTTVALALFGLQHRRSAVAREAMDQCAAPERTLAEFWEAERPLVRAALLTTGDRNRERKADLVDGALDDFVSRWRASQRDMCDAALVDETLRDDMLDLRQRCLGRHRSGVEIVVTLFKDADEALLEHTDDLLSTLPKPDRCADLGYLARIDIDDAEASIRDEVEALRRRLFRVQAEINAARYKEASARIEPMLEEAKSLGSRTLIAQLGIAHGRLAAESGDVEGALQSYLKALHDALSVGAEHLAAEAANHLTYHTGYYQGQHAEGLRWGQVAAGLVERVDDPELRRQHLNYMGALQSLDGRYTEALATFDEAQALAKTFGTKTHDQAALATNRGIILSSLGRREEARAAHQEALGLLIDDYGEDHPDVALTCNSLGTVYLYSGDLPRARELFERARGIQEQALDANHPLLAITLVNLASVYSEQGDPQRGLEAGRRAMTILEAAGLGKDHIFAGYAELTIGDALQRSGDPAALAHLERSVALLETNAGEMHVHVGLPLLSLAEIAIAEGDLERTSALIDRASTLLSTSKEVSDAEFARVDTVRAQLLAGRGEGLEASRLLRKAERTYERLAPHYDHRREAIVELRARLDLAAN